MRNGLLPPACALAFLVAGAARADTLEEQLLREAPAVLARAARDKGDAARGAVLFHQPHLACTKCHSTGDDDNGLGPDLARRADKVADEFLVESVLLPSRVIRKGYETVSVTTRKGRTVVGLLHKETPAELVLRDGSDGRLVPLKKADVDERTPLAASIMPAGLVNQLASRQEFLDLARYLMEIADKGPARARALRPAAPFAALPPPEYEKRVDHAGLISSLDRASFKRGEAIYNRLCVNCHGTREQPGSLPTSPRFASGTFKNGADPYALYQTLTKGYGMMVPQTWMVPQQKYDVIHYLREAYLKGDNPTQYVRVDRAYLDKLPRGDTRGPAPSNIEPWASMDYGPSLTLTVEVGSDGGNFAHKGIAVRLDPGPGGVSRGKAWVVFDHDTLRVAAGWGGAGFIDWNGINFNGRHEVHPRVVGQVAFANPTGPGWADPADGRFDDPRLRGRDGRAYGPLPRSWGRYKGLYHHGQQVVVSYDVGATPVLETFGVDNGLSTPLFSRTFNLGPRERDLVLQAARVAGKGVTLRSPDGGEPSGRAVVFGGERLLFAGLSPDAQGTKWSATAQGDLRLTIPAGREPLRFTLALSSLEKVGDARALLASAPLARPAPDLTPLTRGGPSRWPAKLTTTGQLGGDGGPFAVDTIPLPANNPWLCQLRPGGFDFLPDGRSAAVCTWDGDVWKVSGIDRPEKGLTWQRVASGLFQPLGVKVLGGRVFVTCRDQIVVLHDLDGDGETDFYECFNNDHQVTEHFHEFAMGLQADARGNLYYAKGARHAKTALVPHHGTLLRVSADGTRTDVLATGFRAPNGVCLNPDGTFFLTDQEGHWTPKNRINRVVEGGYYGNVWGYHGVTDTADAAMKPPVCWITNAFDRSPSELLWVEGEAWGPLRGSLLNLSYGYGKVYVVPHETVGGVTQGGLCALPIPQFPTGVMRGRFGPRDGQLYLCGLFAWAGNQTEPGGFYRLRATGKPVCLPVGLRARRGGMEVTFSGELDRRAAADPAAYAVKTWSLRRSAKYGSDHYDERPSKVTGVKVSADGKGVLLEIAGLKPTMCMEIAYTLKGRGGEPVVGAIHNTIHRLGE